MAAEGGDIIIRHDYIYRGEEGEVIPDEATHIFVKARKVREGAFRRHPNIVKVICDDHVEEIEADAFAYCLSLRRVVMPGVKIVLKRAFDGCKALTDVECGKLEIIGLGAFFLCESLRSINLTSVRIVGRAAFHRCNTLTNLKFGNKLERCEEQAFYHSRSLKRITIPLKVGLFNYDCVFQGCVNLRQVDLIENELRETIAALHLKKWRKDMNKEVNSINHILLRARPGKSYSFGGVNGFTEIVPGERTQEIRSWIRSVRRMITHYQAEHQRLLNEATTTLELVLPNNDIVMNNVLSFLHLPPYTF